MSEHFVKMQTLKLSNKIFFANPALTKFKDLKTFKQNFQQFFLPDSWFHFQGILQSFESSKKSKLPKNVYENVFSSL